MQLKNTVTLILEPLCYIILLYWILASNYLNPITPQTLILHHPFFIVNISLSWKMIYIIKILSSAFEYTHSVLSHPILWSCNPLFTCKHYLSLLYGILASQSCHTPNSDLTSPTKHLLILENDIIKILSSAFKYTHSVLSQPMLWSSHPLFTCKHYLFLLYGILASQSCHTPNSDLTSPTKHLLILENDIIKILSSAFEYTHSVLLHPMLWSSHPLFTVIL